MEDTQSLFTPSDEAQRGIEAVYQVLLLHRRGDVIPMPKLALAAGMEDCRVFRSHIVWTARKRVLQIDGIATSGVRDADNVRLLTVSQQLTELPSHRRSKARRQMTKSITEQNAIPAHELTVHQIGVREANVEASQRLRRNIMREERFSNATATNHNFVREPVAPRARKSAPVPSQFSAFTS